MEPKKDNVFECSAVTKWLEIEITNHCWMDCIVCPRKKIENLWFLSFDNFAEIVKLLQEWNYTEVMVCGLWDAFIHPEINDFMEYLFSKIPNIKLFFMTKWLALKKNHIDKIKDLKDRGFNVTLTFSVFSLNEKIYNYLTWWDFYKTFLQKLDLSNKAKINYTLEFMLSTITLKELESFKKFAKTLNKDYWISLVHNWSWDISKKIHEKLFDEKILNWYYVKRKFWEKCEVMNYDYLYIDSAWGVYQCSLNELQKKWYLWKLWEYNLNEFLNLKNSLDYQKLCKDCFYFNYKTFS